VSMFWRRGGAVREASPDIGSHDARVDIDALDGLAVDQERNSALGTGGFAAADIDASARAGVACRGR